MRFGRIKQRRKKNEKGKFLQIFEEGLAGEFNVHLGVLFEVSIDFDYNKYDYISLEYL